MITRELSKVSMLIEDAETQIKLIVKQYWTRNDLRGITKAVDKIVLKTIKQIPYPDLALSTGRSLRQLGAKLLNTLIRNLGFNGAGVQKALALADEGKLTNELLKMITGSGELRVQYYFTQEKGIPEQIFSKDYMKKVSKTITELANIKGLDPNDLTSRNSLRNLAEMTERNETHVKQLEDFKKDGVKLVVCSVHQDCSDRCFHWQGKVYSLDGTSGKTKEGRTYQPLENATDPNNVYYTNPKTGTQYKGGLLGYNCRHKLYEYHEGMGVPYISKAVQEKENKINQKQREYERNIRNWREIALLSMDEKERKFARKKAIELNKRYIEFSLKNERAYYPDRVKILL